MQINHSEALILQAIALYTNVSIEAYIEKLVTEIDTESEDFKAIMLRSVIKSPCKDLVLINVYDSPSTLTYKKANPEADNTLEELTSFLMKLGDSEIIITGDFNARTGNKNFEENEILTNWTVNTLKSKLSHIFRLSGSVRTV